MNTQEISDSIRTEILGVLSSTQKSSVHLSDKEAAAVLGVKCTTLAAWRSTGRYDLKYFKIGRKIRYRITDLADFLAKSVSVHTK